MARKKAVARVLTSGEVTSPDDTAQDVTKKKKRQVKEKEKPVGHGWTLVGSVTDCLSGSDPCKLLLLLPRSVESYIEELDRTHYPDWLDARLWHVRHQILECLRLAKRQGRVFVAQGATWAAWYAFLRRHLGERYSASDIPLRTLDFDADLAAEQVRAIGMSVVLGCPEHGHMHFDAVLAEKNAAEAAKERAREKRREQTSRRKRNGSSPRTGFEWWNES